MRSLSIALIVIFMVGSLAYAAPVGNPTEPSYLKGNNRGKLTGIINVLLGRDFDNGAEVDSGVEYTAKLAYNMWEKIELYLLIGGGNLDIIDDDEFIRGSNVDTDMRGGLLWGGGGTFVVYETDFHYRPLKVGFDAKVQFVDSQVDNIEVNDVNTTFSEDEYKSLEWQIAPGVSYQIDRFIPYAGVTISDMRIEKEAIVNGTGRSDTLHSDNIFGLFVGTDYIFNDNLKLNVEGRFIDETAVSVAGTLMY